jgi:hypothetical protein
MTNRFLMSVVGVAVVSVVVAIMVVGGDGLEGSLPADIGAMTSIHPGEVTRVEIQREGEARGYERVDGEWFQVSPRAAAVKRGVMPGVLEHLLRRPVLSVHDGAPSRSPQGSITLSVPNGPFHVDVLARGLAGQGRLQIGDVIVATDQGFHDLLLDSDLEAWCDASIFSLSPSEIMAFQRTGGGGWMMRVEEGPHGWTMTAPVATRVDEASLGQLLTLVSVLEHGGVVVGDPGPLASYGLEHPASTIEIQERGGAIHRLRIGDSIPGDEPRWYAILKEGGPIVAVEELTVRGLHVDPAAVIHRIASPIDPDDVASIQVVDEAGTTSVTRVSGGWVFSDASAINGNEVDRLLELLTRTMATDLEVVTEYPDQLHVAKVVLLDARGGTLDSINVLREPPGGRRRWAVESGDLVLRVFPESTRIPTSFEGR